ncbi:hypothetical protein BD779DRAFT_1537306 [Infundibulicybe gibba]|nr:hypothetical protein BD779DRAFT_1537306 [Infundibulicybe gibba]
MSTQAGHVDLGKNLLYNSPLTPARTKTFHNIDSHFVTLIMRNTPVVKINMEIIIATHITYRARSRS